MFQRRFLKSSKLECSGLLLPSDEYSFSQRFTWNRRILQNLKRLRGKNCIWEQLVQIVLVTILDKSLALGVAGD